MGLIVKASKIRKVGITLIYQDNSNFFHAIKRNYLPLNCIKVRYLIWLRYGKLIQCTAGKDIQRVSDGAAVFAHFLKAVF